MEKVDCPYCGEETELNCEEGKYLTEDYRSEAECEHCEKKFMVSSSISWNFYGEKADCLNGTEHTWIKKYNSKFYPNLNNREICKECEEERTLE